VQQQDAARLSIAEAQHSPAIVLAFCDEALRARVSDHSRALVALSLLGEMRSPIAAPCLRNLVHQPLPTAGTVSEGEILEQTALATLQAKAIDGLAYLQTASADQEVLWAAASHPSRIVRAEAIEAYLWNHGYSVAARAALERVIQPDEDIFLDRVRRTAKDTGESFNQKLAVFLKTHPEAAPPDPLRRDASQGQRKIPSKTNTPATPPSSGQEGGPQ
jgi:hypothetical protein